MDATDFSSYIPALGFSGIFLIMLRFIWDYFVKKLAEWETRYETMLKDQQGRYDALNTKYQEDLRDWSGLNPRPQTWLNDNSPVWKRSQYGYNPEGDTRRLPNIPEEDRQAYVKRQLEPEDPDEIDSRPGTERRR